MFFTSVFNDAAPSSSFYFQEEATISMIGIRDLHDNVFYYLIFVSIFVTYYLFISVFQNNLNVSIKDLNHNSILEIIWTIIPAIILIFIALPTFKLLYNLDDVLKPLISLKIEGNQWFWNYFINDSIGLNVEFSSYPLTSWFNGQLRFLEVDNKILLPILTPIRLLFSASDVIHSWTIPSFGIKVDCIPGRINHSSLFILREGLFYGQCSELCGLGHSNMPILIHAVNSFNYMNWLFSFFNFNANDFFILSNVLNPLLHKISPIYWHVIC